MTGKVKMRITSLGKVILGGVVYKNGDIVEVDSATAERLENNEPQLASKNAKKVEVKESKKESNKKLKGKGTETKSVEKVKG